MLLDAGADINAKVGRYGNALQVVLRADYKGVVQILLDAGANVNTEGEYSNTLQAVLESIYERVVRILLDTGADVNTKGERYSNALQVVLRGGHEKIVRILLDTKANVNTEGGEQNSISAGITTLLRSLVSRSLSNLDLDIIKALLDTKLMSKEVELRPTIEVKYARLIAGINK